jgi:hypothetical protein
MFAVFTDITSFDSWLASINAELGYPNESGTETYSMPIIHSDGSVIALIDDQIQFTGETINRSQAIEAGFINERIDA